MIRNGAIELLARELRATVGELIDRPAANRVHPVARRDRLRARGEQVERLPARFDAVEPHLARPRRARAQQVHVVVDQPGHHRTPAQVDAPRSGPGQLRHLLGGADRDHAIALDGDRLRDRELLVGGDDLAVGENQVGGRLLCAHEQARTE